MTLPNGTHSVSGMTPDKIKSLITPALTAGAKAEQSAKRAEQSEQKVENYKQQLEETVDEITESENRITNYVYSQTNGEDATILGVVSNPNSSTNNWIDVNYASSADIEELDERTKPQKMLFELPVPKISRPPVLAVMDTVPDSQIDAQVCMVEGAKLWAYGKDRSLYVSNSDGVWEHLSYHSDGLQALRGMYRLMDGSIITYNTGFAIKRSTDEGKTWTVVLPRRAPATLPLTTQSLAVNQNNGHVFYGEYLIGSNDGGKAVLWRSVDNGATFHEFYSWPTDSTSSNRISHIHGVQWDPIGGDVYVMLGDGSPATGIWKVSGSTCVPVLTNSDLTGVTDSIGDFFDAPRAIAMIFFENYIAWASDSTSSPYIFRIHRNDFGVNPQKLERGPRMSSTSWGTAKASEDGSRWVLFSSDEKFPNYAPDRLGHIYSVEDEGSTVYEVATVSSHHASNVATTLQPVGLAENYTDHFWFCMRTGGAYNGAWKVRLGYGGQSLPWENKKPTPPVTHSRSSGIISLAPGATKKVGVLRVPVFAKTLVIYESSVLVLEGSTTGNVGVRIVDSNNNVLFTSSVSSARYSKRAEHGGGISVTDLTGGDTLYVEVYNVFSTPAEMSASIDYAFMTR